MSEANSTVEYRDIPGFPGYRVGNDGSAWSIRRKGRRYANRKNDPLLAESWNRLKTPILENGYPSLVVRHNGNRSMFLIHRLVLELFVGPCPEGMEACHGPDPTRTNCCLNNLRWDTRQSNSDDQKRHGTRARGERSGHAKLTEANVRSARQMYAEGNSTILQIATKFGVSRLTMGEAIRRGTWKHVT